MKKINIKIPDFRRIPVYHTILLVVIMFWIKDQKGGTINNPFQVQVSDTDNFVFLGDSLTDFYPLEEFYDELPVVNSGVSGYQTTDILSRIDSMVTIYNPTKVFLLIGTNDIEAERSEDEIVENIAEIIDRIYEKRPKAKIYLESLLPVNRSEDEKINHDTVGRRTNETIQSINEKLESYAEENDIEFINLYDEFTDENGELALKYTEEGLHLSNLGYLRLTNILLPYFQDE